MYIQFRGIPAGLVRLRAYPGGSGADQPRRDQGMPLLSGGFVMFENVPNIHRKRAGMAFPILLLAAAGIGVILLAGSLGAATSGRGLLSFWSGGAGQMVDTPPRTSGLPEMSTRSGA